MLDKVFDSHVPRVLTERIGPSRGANRNTFIFGAYIILAHLPVPLSRKDNGWPHMLSKNFHKHPLKSLVIFFSSRLHEPVLK